MFERFTERARLAVVGAQEEARLLGHNHIGSEHLLLGLLHEQDSIAAHVLAAAGITVEAARAQVAELGGPSDKSSAGHIPFTQQAKNVLELSLREALEQKSSYIGTEHLLLAVTRDVNGLGAQVLECLGASLPDIRHRVLAAAKAAAPAAEPVALNWPLTQGPGDRPQLAAGARGLLTSINQRLAVIERHLGAGGDEEATPGLRGLVISLNRHLSNIERHLGIAASTEPEAAVDPEPPETPQTPAAETD